MLVTQERELRNFWYAVIRRSALESGPAPFTLLGEKLVLWLDEHGRPAALRDRCCHRSEQLSRGWVDAGRIVCPYHGWTFDSSGACVRMPQLENKAVPRTYCVERFHCRERYGYVWVCLGDPAHDIPHFPEADDPAFRQLDCFYETWATSSPRVVENELDMAHFAVVHRATIGNPDAPLPLSYDLRDLGPHSLHLRAELSVRAPGQQRQNTRSASEVTSRVMDITWFAPFVMRLQLSYPSGLRHVIINHPTPVDDRHVQVVQFHFRDDTDAEATFEQLIAFERKIVDEDRHALEGTDPDLPLEKGTEAHMFTDRAGLMFRGKLAKLLRPKRSLVVQQPEAP